GPRRLVTVRGLDRWDAKSDDGKESKAAEGKGVVYKPLDVLADYAASPSDTTTLLLLADKLDNRRRLVSVAKKDGFLVVCASLPRYALPGWIQKRAREHGHAVSAGAAE